MFDTPVLGLWVRCVAWFEGGAAELEAEPARRSCDLRAPPEPRLTGWPARLRDWEPSGPVMAEAALAGLIVQCTGVATLPPGRASVRVTPVAVPAPVLVIETEKPMGLPGETLGASAVLATWMAAHSTASEAELATPVPSLVVLTVAVLS